MSSFHSQKAKIWIVLVFISFISLSPSRNEKWIFYSKYKTNMTAKYHFVSIYVGAFLTFNIAIICRYSCVQWHSRALRKVILSIKNSRSTVKYSRIFLLRHERVSERAIFMWVVLVICKTLNLMEKTHIETLSPLPKIPQDISVIYFSCEKKRNHKDLVLNIFLFSTTRQQSNRSTMSSSYIFHS